MPRDLHRVELYHITDIDNLASIINSGRLVSDVGLRQSGLIASNIGDNNIKARRMTAYRVPCVDNRFVGEFVPFYYCPRSPMLFTVNMGRTGKPPGCQTGIVHLVTTVAKALELNQRWAISDMNAGAALAEFSSDIATLDTLDWTAIRATYWSHCVTTKAAEFLVKDHFAWTSINTIACCNAAAAARVRAILSGNPHQPAVTVEPYWYY